ncbi:hypothetical protein CC78DRAFT_587404 [Lojkania enalia]|uniref:LYR motif-containing protein Cup1-like N-terminal domain-containing protein n=1 Tax=Lojkania enalia TaxID=147567 RepID=A0A9P4JXE1_9PLEO|nr:hypothetical protein CC78DRAFT_587404 [Didymosphaeria enalia]
MPLPVQYSASQLKSIHLLRALLREATYLPDSSARSYFRRYIINRFKAYQPSQNATASKGVQAVEKYRHRAFKRRRVAIINERTREMQRKAHRGLNYFRRANNGELSCLHKVMLFTYGRIGRRKYALLGDLLKPELPSIGGQQAGGLVVEPGPLQKLYYSNKRFLSIFDAPTKVSESHISISISNRYRRLKTVVHSQAQEGIALVGLIKRDKIQAPSKNAWERQMPIKRARNIVRRWYAETMTRLLPPLPNEEWDQLKALAYGEKKWPGPIRRRTPAIEPNPEPHQNHDYWSAVVHEGLSTPKPSKADRPTGKERPHNITPRLMRRLYGKILGLSCKLEWHDQKGKWSARWGSDREASHIVYGGPVNDILFAGVDAKGRKPKDPPRSIQ